VTKWNIKADSLHETSGGEGDNYLGNVNNDFTDLDSKKIGVKEASSQNGYQHARTGSAEIPSRWLAASGSTATRTCLCAACLYEKGDLNLY
jgi:hypothetical protein